MVGLCGVLVLAHEDERRRIEEFNGSDFSIQYFKVSRALPLGNHYHTRRVETFVVLSLFYAEGVLSQLLV